MEKKSLPGRWLEKDHGGYNCDTGCWLEDKQEFVRWGGQSVKAREVEESSGNSKKFSFDGS